MDLKFTKEDIKFKEQVREFIKNNLPASKQKVINGGSYSKDEIIKWQKALFANNWFAYNWPKEYGGCEWTTNAEVHI